MSTQRSEHLKKISLIFLGVALFSTALQVVGYFQTQYQLVSPLIPKSTIDIISKPHLQLAGISFILFLVAFIFHRYSKYKASIVICIFTYLFPQLYIEITG